MGIFSFHGNTLPKCCTSFVNLGSPVVPPVHPRLTSLPLFVVVWTPLPVKYLKYYIKTLSAFPMTGFFAFQWNNPSNIMNYTGFSIFEKIEERSYVRHSRWYIFIYTHERYQNTPIRTTIPYIWWFVGWAMKWLEVRASVMIFSALISKCAECSTSSRNKYPWLLIPEKSAESIWNGSNIHIATNSLIKPVFSKLEKRGICICNIVILYWVYKCWCCYEGYWCKP